MRFFVAVIVNILLILGSSLVNRTGAQSSFQSGPFPAHSSAGGISYDPIGNVLYVTGATYQPFGASTPHPEPSCLLGILSFPELEWIDQNSYGDDSMLVMKRCDSVVVDASSVFTIGGTFREGFVMELERQSSGSAIGPQISWEIMHAPTMNYQVYPNAVALHDAHVFVASLVVYSDADASSSSNNQMHVGDVIVVNRCPRSSTSSARDLDWIQAFSSSFYMEVDADNETASSGIVTLGGMIVKGDSLWIVGSVRSASGDDQDGFITILDIPRGRYVRTSVGRLGHESSSESSSSNAEDNSSLHGICDDPNDPTAIYVVGALHTQTETDGSMVVPVIQKLRMVVDDEDSSWTIEWTQILRPGTSTNAVALACHVWEEVVYVAGNAQEDVFAAQLRQLDGTVQWIQQVGSSGVDALAPGGGLAVHPTSGTAILCGTTDGSLFRTKNDDSRSDLFCVTMNPLDGSHATPVTTSSSMTTTVVDSQVVDSSSTLMETDGTSSSSEEEEDAPSDNEDETQSATTPTSDPVTASAKAKASSFGMGQVLPFSKMWGGDNVDNEIIGLIVIGSLLLVCCAVGVCMSTQRRKQGKEQQRTRFKNLFGYLRDIDMEDIDIRRSPAGGFHVSYLNGLASGEKITTVSDMEDDEDHPPKGGDFRKLSQRL